MDAKKLPPKARMEEYERRMRRERERSERQQPAPTVNLEHSLFPEPRRVNPSEGDDDITATLGQFEKIKDLISPQTVGISSWVHQQMSPSVNQLALSNNLPASNAQLRLSHPQYGYQQQPHQQQQLPQQQQQSQQPYHHQQQQQQSRQPPYIKQADNKPPYNGRGGYPGQSVKNDLRSSSGMAPPKGPPPLHQQQMPQNSSMSSSSNSAYASNVANSAGLSNSHHGSSILPNGGSIGTEKGTFLGPPVSNSSSSAMSHNGRFSQPSIPKQRPEPFSGVTDIKQILNEIKDKYSAPAAPLTLIAATPHTTITENYNLNGPSKHKYAFDALGGSAPITPLEPIAPLSSPPQMTTSLPPPKPAFPSVVPSVTSSNSSGRLRQSPPTLANTNRNKESSMPTEPLRPLIDEKIVPPLEKQSSTLENDLELSESDDDRKRQNNHSAMNSSDSSQSDSSESGSEDSSKGTVDNVRQSIHHHQHHHHLSHGSQQMHSAVAASSLSHTSPASSNKKRQSQSASIPMSSSLSNTTLNSAGSSCSAPSSTSSSSNKTPSPSDNNNIWQMSRYFGKAAAAQQPQNETTTSPPMATAAPVAASSTVAPTSTALSVAAANTTLGHTVNSMNIVNVPVLLPGGAHILPDIASNQGSTGAAQPISSIVKNERIIDEDDDDQAGSGDEEDGEIDEDDEEEDNSVRSKGKATTSGFFGLRKQPDELTVTQISPLMSDIKKEVSENTALLYARNHQAQGQQVPILHASEFVSIPTTQIKREGHATSGINAGLGGDEKTLAPELRKQAEELSGIGFLSALSSDSNSEPESKPKKRPKQIVADLSKKLTPPIHSPGKKLTPIRCPDGTLHIPGLPAATTALLQVDRTPPKAIPSQLQQNSSITVSLVGGPLATTASSTNSQRAKKPRKKLKQAPARASTIDSSDEEDGVYNSPSPPTASILPNHAVVSAAVAELNSSAAKKGRGRPRKQTPNQSGNISSASSTTKGPTLTAKKDIAKKPPGRRRISRQDSTGSITASTTVTSANAVVTAATALSVAAANAKKAKHQSPVVLTTTTPLSTSTVAKEDVASSAHEDDAASSDDSSTSSSSSGSSSSSSSSSDSEEGSGASSSGNEQNENKTASTISTATAVSVSGGSGRRIVKQLNKVKSSLDDANVPGGVALQSAHLSHSQATILSSGESSSEEYVSNAAAVAYNPTAASVATSQGSGSSSHRSQNQQSPYKASAGAPSSSHSRLSSSSSSASSSDDDCDRSVNKKDKKLPKQPKSDKNKINTLTRIFNPKEGGAKKQGQVVIIDQSEELTAKEHHQQQQQQKQHHNTTNAAFRSSQENLAHPGTTSIYNQQQQSQQSPHTRSLTPGHIGHGNLKSPHSTISTSRKRSASRTPHTRTPTPTQLLHGGPQPSPSGSVGRQQLQISLICSIDLSRLRNVRSEWFSNTYRICGNNTPLSAGQTPTRYHQQHQTGGAGRTPHNDEMEALLNAAAAADMRLKRPPLSTGSRTPTTAASMATQRLDDMGATTGYSANGRLSSRSADGSLTPKDSLQQPNGYTFRASFQGHCSPSTAKLLAATGGVKHEQNIKYEPDMDVGKMSAAIAYCNDINYKLSGSGVKQEVLFKNEIKPTPNEAVLSDTKTSRRKRSSSSSPYKEKKRKKEKESVTSNTISNSDNCSIDGQQLYQKELNHQLPPTNHDRLPATKTSLTVTGIDKKSILNDTDASAMPPPSQTTQAEVSPAHFQNTTTCNNNNTSNYPMSATTTTNNTAIMPPPVGGSGNNGSLHNHDSMTRAETTASQQVQAQSQASSLTTNTLSLTPLPPSAQSAAHSTSHVEYRSYFERDEEALSEDLSKNTKFLEEAVRRKHAADREQNTFNQVTLYLESVIYFLLSGAALEQIRSSEESAWTMYKDTLALIKYISSKFRHIQNLSANGQQETLNKVAFLSLRCQSLISLKLYKMKRTYCRHIINACTDFFKNGKGDVVNGNTSSSLSPSNSVGSQGSGSHTPPGRIVPQDIHSALQQQNQYFSYLTSSHDLWEQADRLVRQENLTDFFIALDRENGPLTLHSTMYEVFRYVQAGLKKLKNEMSIK